MAAEWRCLQRGAVMHVEVWGDLDLEGAPALDVPVAVDVEHVVVDLRPVRFIDSMGVAALVRLHRRAPLRIVATDGSMVRRVLALTGVDSIIDVYEHPHLATSPRPELFRIEESLRQQTETNCEIAASAREHAQTAVGTSRDVIDSAKATVLESRLLRAERHRSD